MQRSWKWFQQHAKSAHAKVWLALFSFSESSFFVIPPDFLLVALLSARAGRWLYYASITTLASIVGAVFGYLLGLFVFEPVVQPLISAYGLVEEFSYVGELYSSNVFLTVLTAAFTPIPFKVFVLAGGFFSVPFMPFFLATILGRGVRYFLLAWISHRFGPVAAEAYMQEFKFYTIVAVLLLAIAVAVFVDIPALF